MELPLVADASRKQKFKKNLKAFLKFTEKFQSLYFEYNLLFFEALTGFL